jgi:hypothetical protein
MEELNSRLGRFLRHHPDELFGTILDSINNFFIPELRNAGELRLETLVFLGTHSVMQTVSEKIFGRSGETATEFYLKNFVDHPSIQDRQFSLVASDVHSIRNIKAHLWMSSRLHDVVIDYQQPEGWRRLQRTLSLNPAVYLEQFFDGFNGRIWNWEQLAPQELFVVQKYRYLRDWLELPKGDPIRHAIEKLDAAAPSLRSDEAAIKLLIKERFKLP